MVFEPTGQVTCPVTGESIVTLPPLTRSG
jgi:hypothetical protein